MKSTFYYDGHYLEVAEKIKNYINTLPTFLSPQTAGSTRAIGDAIEYSISEKFNSLLGDWCVEYWNSFARRAMADFAFTDREGIYSVVDVKTHREDSSFNMPNLTSVERLATLYESDENVFSLIMVKYSIDDTRMNATEVIFSPIEYLDWDCLTIGALGWGQIQLANSNYIKINNGYSRKKWMLQLCDTMHDFYPKEIQKINRRMGRFDDEKAYWESREDVWR